MILGEEEIPVERLPVHKFQSDNYEPICWKAIGLDYICTIEQEIEAIRNYAIGFLEGWKLWLRPKNDSVAILFFYDEVELWFHVSNELFHECFPDIILENNYKNLL